MALCGKIPQGYTLWGQDLETILASAENDLQALSGKHILLTGCTGFMGKWIVESLIFSNQKLNSAIHLHLLTRNKSHFLQSMNSALDTAYLHFLECDIASLTPDLLPACDYIIHGSNLNNDGSPSWAWRHMNAAVTGLQNVLAVADFFKSERGVFLSSGASYAAVHNAATTLHIKEPVDFSEKEMSEGNVYGLTKHFLEVMLTAWLSDKKTTFPIARCFTFLGAHIPLAGAQAAGNFFNDALHGRAISIKGDGRAVRSYMYGVDMVVALLAILVRGQASRIYNVGSDKSVTIGDLAHTIAQFANVPTSILNNAVVAGNAPSYYVPEVSSLEDQLGVTPVFSLDEALESTWYWLLQRHSSGFTI